MRMRNAFGVVAGATAPAIMIAVLLVVLTFSASLTESFSPPRDADAFSIRKSCNRCTSASACCFASMERREVLASAIRGGIGLVMSGALSVASVPSKAMASQEGEAVVVETKSPFIALMKNFLPSDDDNNNNNSESSLKSTISKPDPLDSIAWNGPKKRGLNAEQMADAINDGLREREWFVTGRGMPELYSDSFTFSDPDVSLSGYEAYCRQVRRLFDQESSPRCELICCSVTAPNAITVLWRNSGRVSIGPPGGILLKPYLVTTTLQMDPNDGNLIVSQVDEFQSDSLGLLLYQFPLTRSLAGPPAPTVDVLRQQCDFYTCKIK